MWKRYESNPAIAGAKELGTGAFQRIENSLINFVVVSLRAGIKGTRSVPKVRDIKIRDGLIKDETLVNAKEALAKFLAF